MNKNTNSWTLIGPLVLPAQTVKRAAETNLFIYLCIIGQKCPNLSQNYQKHILISPHKLVLLVAPLIWIGDFLKFSSFAVLLKPVHIQNHKNVSLLIDQWPLKGRKVSKAFESSLCRNMANCSSHQLLWCNCPWAKSGWLEKSFKYIPLHVGM